MMQEVEVLKTIQELICSFFSEEQFTLSSLIGILQNDIISCIIKDEIFTKNNNVLYTKRGEVMRRITKILTASILAVSLFSGSVLSAFPAVAVEVGLLSTVNVPGP